MRKEGYYWCRPKGVIYWWGVYRFRPDFGWETLVHNPQGPVIGQMFVTDQHWEEIDERPIVREPPPLQKGWYWIEVSPEYALPNPSPAFFTGTQWQLNGSVVAGVTIIGPATPPDLDELSADR